MPQTQDHVMDRLFRVILDRREADPSQSYTAYLLAAGQVAIANKLGEEAIETLTAALAQSPEQVVSESADLLYHLAVLWAKTGVTPEDVWAELANREGLSGIEEKNNRSPK